MSLSNSIFIREVLHLKDDSGSDQVYGVLIRFTSKWFFKADLPPQEFIEDLLDKLGFEGEKWVAQVHAPFHYYDLWHLKILSTTPHPLLEQVYPGQELARRHIEDLLDFETGEVIQRK